MGYKIPPKLKFKDMDGDALVRVIRDENGKVKERITLTLGMIIRESLCAELNDKATGEDKAERYVIASRFFGDAISPVEVNAKELGTIRKRIGEVQAALVVGQCWDMLDNLEGSADDAEDKAKPDEPDKPRKR